MTLEHYVIAALMLYLIVRELFFMYSTQKLVNKLMSRDYFSYQMSEKVGKAQVKLDDKPNVKDDGLNEDMSTIFN